jgi:oxygen-independent coproporphyrinogen-3 oxidase
MDPIAIYIHIPFCRSKCSYCSFNSYAGLRQMYAPYIEALEREMALAGEAEDHPQASTIYVGGGTPTVLGTDLVARILQACREHFVLLNDAEISIEANPGTVDAEYLYALRELGIRRLSLGAQSFSNEMLALLGRSHTAADTREAYQVARQTGFGNINLDLIYALPGQTVEQWQADLSEAISLKPEHLSLYCLSIEEGTSLADMISAGTLVPPDSDLAATMYTLAEDLLAQAGYEQYEISNWARPAHECRHNITYWCNTPYLGFGAGAASFRHRRRYRNVASPQEYVELTMSGQSSIADREEIDVPLEMSETMIMGLRLSRGVLSSEFEARFGRSLVSVYGDQIRELVGQGLLDVNGSGARLTARGRLLGNEVFEVFLPD